MRRILFLLLVIGILTYRRRAFERDDRTYGYGAFAPVEPKLRTT